VGSFKRQLADRPDLLDQNKYTQVMLATGYKPAVQKPELYKHYFLEISRQLREISQTDGPDRYAAFMRMADAAIRYYGFIDSAGVNLEPQSGGEHLPFWQTAANEYAKEQGWR
jgi:hypothetical protein